MKFEQLITTRAQEISLLEEEQQGLRPRILGKGGLKDILQYSQEDLVSGYEAFVTLDDLSRTDEEFGQIPKGLIVGAHNITYAPYEGTVRPNNLSLEGPEGDFWEETARKTIDLVEKLGGSYFTTHIGELVTAKELEYIKNGTTNEIREAYLLAKRAHIRIAAGRISRLAEYAREKGRQVAIENDTYWTSTKYDGTMFLNDPASVSFFFVLVPDDVGFVFDEEHAYRAAVFGPVWSDYLPRHLNATDPQTAGSQTLRELHAAIEGIGIDTFHNMVIQPYLEQFLHIVRDKIIAVHNCGWDWRHDSTDLETPLPGTSNHNLHLPLRRVIPSIGEEGILVRDTIDHRLVLETIRNNVTPEKFNNLNIVMEYARHQSNRRYNLPRQSELSPQERQQQEFDIAARSMRHLIRGLQRRTQNVGE